MSDGGGKKGGNHHEDEHEEHVNHEAWVIPYADVLTLLMALFLVLFALGRTDDDKLELAADSFRRELGGGGDSVFDLGVGTGGDGDGPLAPGSFSVLNGLGPVPVRTDGTLPSDEPIDDDGAIAPPEIEIMPTDSTPSAPDATFEIIEEAEELAGDPLTEVEQIVRARAAGTGLTETIGFRREERGLVVTIVTDQVLFAEGRADVQPDGVRILDVVAGALLDIPNKVAIEGHTDSRPISTARFPSNWELSTNRATSVLRYFTEQREFPRDRLSAAGYADTRPLSDTDDPASLAKNRRVEIVVLSTAP